MSFFMVSLTFFLVYYICGFNIETILGQLTFRCLIIYKDSENQVLKRKEWLVDFMVLHGSDNGDCVVSQSPDIY